MTSDSRAKFEEWASGFGWRSYEMTRRQDSYADHAVSLQWQSWVAGWSARDSEVERLREDAERYRWMREVFATKDRNAQDAAIDALGEACENPTTPEEFDAAIDAARSLLSSQVKESGK